MFYIDENPRNKNRVNIEKTAIHQQPMILYGPGDTQWKISIPKEVFEEHKNNIYKFEHELDDFMFNHKKFKQPLPDYIVVIQKCRLIKFL